MNSTYHQRENDFARTAEYFSIDVYHLAANEREDELGQGFQGSARYSPNLRRGQSTTASLPSGCRSNQINYQSRIHKSYWCAILGFLGGEQTKSKPHTTPVGHPTLEFVAFDMILRSHNILLNADVGRTVRLGTLEEEHCEGGATICYQELAVTTYKPQYIDHRYVQDHGVELCCDLDSCKCKERSSHSIIYLFP